MSESQGEGVQCGALDGIADRSAVEGIAQQRVSQCVGMHADLMGST